MTTEAELKALKKDVAKLATDLEKLADLVADVILGRARTISASRARTVARDARNISLRNR